MDVTYATWTSYDLWGLLFIVRWLSVVLYILIHCLLARCPSSMQKQILDSLQIVPLFNSSKGCLEIPQELRPFLVCLYNPCPLRQHSSPPFLGLLIVITCWECKYIPCWGCCSWKLKVTAPGDTRMVLDVGSWAEVGSPQLRSHTITPFLLIKPAGSQRPLDSFIGSFMAVVLNPWAC